MYFNDEWRYQFTFADKFCFLERIYVARGHLDELQKAEKYPTRWSLKTGFTVNYSPAGLPSPHTPLDKTSRVQLTQYHACW